MPARKPDYYTVLGLTSDASDDTIRTAYKKLALQWHPDRHLVGKEHAAQMFIEVNQAYHALMDGKESTHSSSTETMSSTTAPTASSAEPACSDTHSKSTQASSRPPSASSNSSKRSCPHSSKPFSASCDVHGSNTSKPSTQSGASSTSSHAPSSDDLKSSSHSQSAKPNVDKSQHQSKSSRKFSKSYDHPRGPSRSAASKTTPSSTHSRSSEGPSGSARSKSEKTTGSSPTEPQAKRDPRLEKIARSSAGKSRSPKPVVPPPSGHMHKSTKFGFADGFVHKLSKGTTKGKQESLYSLPHDQETTPFGSPLRAINTPRGASKEWIFPLPLTLDEMYRGTKYRFLVTREFLSHRTEQVEISVDIPPGMRSGTRIVCPRTGHQRKDGTLQDVVFLVEEVPDERFSRVKDDLFLDICIPWADPLADQGGEICIQGIDGKQITFTLPYPIYDRATEGQVLVKGVGMPIRDGRRTVGRGDMIVRWRVVFAHQSKWQTLKRALHFDV